MAKGLFDIETLKTIEKLKEISKGYDGMAQAQKNQIEPIYDPAGDRHREQTESSRSRHEELLKKADIANKNSIYAFWAALGAIAVGFYFGLNDQISDSEWQKQQGELATQQLEVLQKIQQTLSENGDRQALTEQQSNKQKIFELQKHDIDRRLDALLSDKN